ncbi:proprotein convertase P-domain-containing protein [Lewinella sp. JB7]|uniref:proprotein convertase P-domain-containing protein n=1 Tax=Lewinella sp. JB7 TaxID=2962887 RepID=UPI0020C99851|nr:proprotein convertase P-domain-containing protein [Lewinella sp. JB7]MCP9234402.1 T9SS type A sorting domain-containing protein [Lewinella sp. JB7]
MFRVPLLLLFGWLIVANPAVAQRGVPRAEFRSLPVLDLPLQDNAILLRREAEAHRADRPREFAVTLPVQITPDREGQWTTVDGRATWHLRVRSPGAKSLNLGFTGYRLPQGAELYLATEEVRYGPFTSADNADHAQFWSPLLPGDELLIELVMPDAGREGTGLVLSSVNHDFVGVADQSGHCNIDVVCGSADGFPLIDDYRDVIRSVAAYTLNGRSQCTGFLVNNTNQDGRPFFITAEHCNVDESSAPSLVAYWNFENSSCRPPDSAENGAAGNGKLEVFNSGARLRARHLPTDLVLLEFDDPVNPRADAFFAGWSNEATAPADGVLTVHHPNVEEKRITYSYQPTAVSNITGDSLYAAGDFLRVPTWDAGTTQAGSSGAPLFDLDGRVRGQLFGGRASCERDGDDMFGFLHRSWTGGGTPDTRLVDWLDPNQTGAVTLDGLEQADLPFLLTAKAGSLTSCVTDSVAFTVRLGEGFAETNNVTVSTDDNLTLYAPSVASRGRDFQIIYRGTVVPAMAGEYSIRVTVTGEGVADELTLRLRLTDGAPSAPTPGLPVAGESDVDPFAQFTWAAREGATAYNLQLSTDPTFASRELDLSMITETRLELVYPLAGTTTYYWRVRSRNACGAGEWSATSTFTTSDRSCTVKYASDLPLTISSRDSVRVVSEIYVANPITISSLEVTLGLEHTYIGDVYADLVAPDGTVISLFRPLQNGLCAGRNLYVNFADDAPVTAESFGEDCETGRRDDYRRVQSRQPLSSLNGTLARGTWQLLLTDRAIRDGGSLTDFGLNICGERTRDREVGIGLRSAPITSCSNGDGEARLQLRGTFTDPDLRVEAGNLALDNYSYSIDRQSGEVLVRFSAWTLVGPGTFDLSYVVTDDDGTERRAVSTLTVLPIPEPVPPATVRADSTTVTFYWRTSDVAREYRLEIAETEDFARVVGARTSPINVLTLPRADLPEGFYWRLVAVNDCGEFPGPAQFVTLEDPNALLPGTVDPQLSLYPNPTRGILHLEAGAAWVNKPLHLVLYDAAGRPVRQWERRADGPVQIDIQGVPTGVYHLRISGAPGSVTRRVLLLH